MISPRDNEVPFIESPIYLLFKRKREFKYSVDEGVVVRFIRDLSTLINAAVPLVKSLEVLAKQQRNKTFSSVVGDLGRSVHSGMSLSTSLMKYPGIFDVLMVNMVRAGEASCSLGEVFQRIASHKEKDLKLRKKIKAIMFYPFIVISIAVLIVSLLFLFIIPKFELVFSTALNQTTLPLATRMIISVSHSFQTIGIILSVAVMATLLMAKLMNKEVKDRVTLKVPIIGRVIRDINSALFSRILGTLIANGVPLIEAMKVGENVATNCAIRATLRKISNQVEDGETLSNAIESEGQFSEMVIGMIHVGEETGTLSDMLLEIANKLDDDIELVLGHLTTILEPLMTLLLAAIIGSIVVALFLPIVHVMNNVVSY